MKYELPGAAYDNKIYEKFAKATIEKKLKNKQSFCEEFGLFFNKKTPLISTVVELSDKNGADVLAKIEEGLVVLNFTLVFRAIGSNKFQELLHKIENDHKGKVLILENNEDNVRKILAASDASVFFVSGAENEKLIEAAMSYACLPVAPQSCVHLVENYNPNEESGNGFTFQEGNYWSLFEALVRMKESFRFPYDYKNIQKAAIGG